MFDILGSHSRQTNVVAEAECISFYDQKNWERNLRSKYLGFVSDPVAVYPGVIDVLYGRMKHVEL